MFTTIIAGVVLGIMAIGGIASIYLGGIGFLLMIFDVFVLFRIYEMYSHNGYITITIEPLAFILMLLNVIAIYKAITKVLRKWVTCRTSHFPEILSFFFRSSF